MSFLVEGKRLYGFVVEGKRLYRFVVEGKRLSKFTRNIQDYIRTISKKPFL